VATAPSINATLVTINNQATTNFEKGEFMNTQNQITNHNRLSGLLKLSAASAVLVLVTGLPVAAQTHDHTAPTAGQEVKAPHTAQEHRAHAEQYQQKAATYRKEAAAHQQMLADYSKTVARNPKDTNENAYIRKMRLHCQKYSKAAEALALEAEEMAKFHTLRAKEVEGK
jgi:hypothetical protein